jgi:hypothetical protein
VHLELPECPVASPNLASHETGSADRPARAPAARSADSAVEMYWLPARPLDATGLGALLDFLQG